MKLFRTFLLLSTFALMSSASDIPFPTCFPCGDGDVKFLEWLVMWIGW